jgi:uncharacterized protein HemX
MKKSKKMSVGKKIAIGAGVAAIGAGAYYLLGPKAKAHQKKVSVLANKAKKEAKKEMKEIKKEIKKVKTVSKKMIKQFSHGTQKGNTKKSR